MRGCVLREKNMNEMIKQIYERKSVRVFEDREISAEDKNTILTAAAMAPTACNQQRYTILSITDQAIKDKLAVSCDHQPFIAKAKMVLVFLADCRKWYDAYAAAGSNPRKPAAGDLMLAVTDAAIAAQNAVTAAWALGIGSCYIGDIIEHCDYHREILGLPEYVFPALMLVFGYPTRQQAEREKPDRFPMEHIVHENAYRVMDEAELRKMFAGRAGERGFDVMLQDTCRTKFNCEFAREMSKSTAQYLKPYMENTPE